MTIAKTVTLLLLVLPFQLWALGSDRDQPIEVEADSLEVRETEKISIYEGNVSLVQGSLEIRSDRLVIHFNETNDPTLMQMTGAPAKFRQLDDDQMEMKGQAIKINYTASQSSLELRGNARFSRAGDTIESDLIRIDTEGKGIRAGSSDSDDRVKMLIQPRPDSNSAE
jgi:lipopolysaccharide export system protein LptA